MPLLAGLLAPYHLKLRRLKAHVTACLVHLCVEGPSGFATFASRAFALPAMDYGMCLMTPRSYRPFYRRRCTGSEEDPFSGPEFFLCIAFGVCMQCGNDDQPIFQHLN